MSKNTILMSLITILLSGCATHSSFSMLSDRRLDLNKITAAKLQHTVPVTAESHCMLLAMILPVSLCSLDETVSEALAEGGGDVLLDAAITKTQFNIILVNYWGWRVSGRAAHTQ